MIDIMLKDNVKARELNCNGEYMYVVQNCVLIASKKEGYVDISYKAISLDDEGFPLISDNESYKVTGV